MLMGREQRSGAAATKLFRGEVEKQRKGMGSTAPATLILSKEARPQRALRSIPLPQLLHALPAVIPSCYSPRDTFAPRFPAALGFPSPKRPCLSSALEKSFPFTGNIWPQPPVRRGVITGTFQEAPYKPRTAKSEVQRP